MWCVGHHLPWHLASPAPATSLRSYLTFLTAYWTLTARSILFIVQARFWLLLPIVAVAVVHMGFLPQRGAPAAVCVVEDSGLLGPVTNQHFRSVRCAQHCGPPQCAAWPHLLLAAVQRSLGRLP